MVCENEVEEVITFEYLITSSFLTKKNGLLSQMDLL